MPKAKNTRKIPQKNTNKQILYKDLNEVFFYDRKKLTYLVIFNIFLVCFIYKLNSCLFLNNDTLQYITSLILTMAISLAIVALCGSIYVTIRPQRLALITNEGITIDHNEELKWDEIKEAKEVTSACLYKQKAIALHTKKGVSHNLRFMQRVCENNLFTAFSIPLYAMHKKDADKITKIIKQKCKYKKEK